MLLGTGGPGRPSAPTGRGQHVHREQRAASQAGDGCGPVHHSGVVVMSAADVEGAVGLAVVLIAPTR